MDYTGFQWRQVEPDASGQRVWQRDVDECELFYHAVSRQYKATGRSFFHMTGHLSLKITNESLEPSQEASGLFDNALRQAWLCLRNRHPAIASQTKWDQTRQKYIKEYRHDTRGWQEETIVFIGDSQTGSDFANSDPPAPDIPTLYVLCPAIAEDEGIWTRRDLVFRSPHDIIDGIGTLYLLNNLAELVSEHLATANIRVTADVEPLSEEARLSPPFRIAADVPVDVTQLVQSRLAASSTAVEKDSAAEDAKPIGLPFKKGPLLPGKHQRVEIIIPRDETSRIIGASKRVGATVTHIFHAAIAIVLRDLQGQPTDGTARHVQYVNYILRNERASCKPPFNDGKLHPAGVYHSVSSQKLVIDMTIAQQGMVENESQERRQAFLNVVATMRDFYHMVRDDKQHSALVPHIWAQATPSIPPPTSDAERLPIPPPPELAPVSISSMGRIDNIMRARYDRVELHNPWVTGEELKNGMGLFLGTFREELALSAAYNDAWHDHEEAIGFLKNCLTVVRNGLDLH